MLIFSGMVGLFDFFIPFGMLLALKHLDVSFTLVTVRIISSIVLLLIGYFALGDSLTIYNIIGFFLGVIAIFLLSGFSLHKKYSVDRTGLIGVIIATIAIICSHTTLKYGVADLELNIDTFMFLKFGITFFIVLLYMTFTKGFRKITKSQLQINMPFAFISGILFVAHFLYFLPNIYILGPLSLGYKILSYSLVVPIILSLLFYDTQITKIKFFGIFLTILSITLFL